MQTDSSIDPNPGAQARELFQAGDYSAAEALCRQALEQQSGDPQLTMMLSFCLQRMGRIDDALQVLEGAATHEDADAGIHHHLASLLVELGRPGPARQSLKRCLKADPNHLQGRTLLGHVELGENRLQAAADSFNAALRIDADHPAALTGLAMTLLKGGQPEIARSHAERAAQLEPRNAGAQIALAQSYQALGHHSFAEQGLRNATELQPDSGAVWGAFATQLARNGQHAEAVKAFQRALKLGTQTNRMSLGLASCLQQIGRLSEARSVVERFIAQRPDNPVAIALLVGILLDQGQAEPAGTWLERLKDETGPRVELLRARLAELLGDLDQAHALANSLHLDADTQLADQARLLSGRVAGARGTAVVARKALQPLIAAGRHQPTASWLLADALAGGGQIDKAREVLEQLIESDTGASPAAPARTARRLAMLLDRAGDHESAGQFLQSPGWHSCEALSKLGQNSPPALRAMWDGGFEAVSDQAPVDDGRPQPIFVLGWPGSGRDLLLAALENHADVIALDPTREKARRDALGLPMAPEQAAALDDSRVRLGRKRFVGELRGQPISASTRILDPGWWEVTSLPVLARFFPAARVIVPRVDLAALELHWRLAGYRDIEDILAGYNDERRRLLKWISGLALSFIDVPLSPLLTQPEAALGKLGAALGVEFDASAAAQVASLSSQSPYACMFNWPHYRQHLVSVAPSSD